MLPFPYSEEDKKLRIDQFSNVRQKPDDWPSPVSPNGRAI